MLVSSEKSSFSLLEDVENLKIGNNIQVEYSTDLRIDKIHSLIRDVFSYHVFKRNLYEKDLNVFKDLKERSGYSKDIEEKEIKIKTLLNNYNVEIWEKYCEEVKEILSRYEDIISDDSEEFTIGLSVKKEKEDLNLTERLFLIRKYLDISKKYIEIDYIFYPPYELGCQECDQVVDEMKIDDEKGVYVCDCGNIFGTVFSVESVHVDPEKIETSEKSSYDPRVNFIKRLKSYQGIHTKRISEEFLTEIDDYAQKKYNLPPASEIRKMPADKYGHRGEMTSVELLKEILKETNNQIHFEDINPICYKLWNWKVPQIEHLIPKIHEDYIRTQEVYKRLNPSGSSINVELRLYWHLRIAGHECMIEDFKIPHSRNSRKRNSHVFRKMCEETGLEFFPIM